MDDTWESAIYPWDALSREQTDIFCEESIVKIRKIGFGLLFGLCAMAARADAVFVSSNATFGTFDAMTGSVSLPILFGTGFITDVDISIDFAKCGRPGILVPTATACPNGAEEFASEIFFYLVSPANTRVNLVYTFSPLQGSTKPLGSYPSSSNVGGRHLVLFDDQAASPVGPVMTTGSFRPEEPLSDFNGETPTGTWTLFVGDSVAFDPLSFFSACLKVTTDSLRGGSGSCPGITSIPEPAPLSLALMGLTALAGARVLRRRS